MERQGSGGSPPSFGCSVIFFLSIFLYLFTLLKFYDIIKTSQDKGEVMKRKIFCFVRIALSAVTLPLWFVKIFKGVGHFPDRNTGEIVKRVFRHSILENIKDGYSLVFTNIAYAVMTIALISFIINMVTLMRPHKKSLTVLANIVFWLAIGMFVVFFLLAANVVRGY